LPDGNRKPVVSPIMKKTPGKKHPADKESFSSFKYGESG
jgi:hypothetical protein